MTHRNREGDGVVPPDFGRLLPGVSTPPPGPASRELARRLRRAESRNVTFLGPDFPVFWTDARGANVRDADGNVYLDATGAFGVALAGHGHPAMVEAVRRQAGRLVHAMGDVHPAEVKVELLERLAALVPWDAPRTVLASSGSEAVEIALKTALLATGRPGIVAFRGGYHGLTVGALAATEREDFRSPFLPRLYPGVRFADFPGTGGTGDEAGAEAALRSLDEALEAAESDGTPVGAVIVEPVQGRGGVRVPPPGFLSGVAERARGAGALLVLDEIFTGLGRMGTLFGFHQEGVVPDLLCLGKALGGGLPLSACIGPAEVMDAWPPSRGEALHTSTFLGHPLACAAALAFLDVLEQEELAARCREKGERLRKLLVEATGGVPGVEEIRGRGLMVGLSLAKEGEGRGTGGRVAAAALARGLFVLPAGPRGEVVELTPPAVISGEQLEWSVDALVEAVRETAAGC